MRTVYFRWSAADVHSGTLMRWKRMRMGNGKENTNCMGVAPVIKSWLFGSWRLQYARSNYRTGNTPPSKRSTANWFRNIRGQERVGFGVLQPYTALYPTREDAYRRTNEIKRPTLKQLERLVRRRKQ